MKGCRANRFSLIHHDSPSCSKENQQTDTDVTLPPASSGIPAPQQNDHGVRETPLRIPRPLKYP